MSEYEPTATRELRFPHSPATEDEYIAFRKRKRGETDVDFDSSLTFSESLVVETAQKLHSTGLDVKRFLIVLRQPASQLGVDPEDVYCSTGNESTSPIESEHISLEDVRWLSSYCKEALSTLEGRESELNEEHLDKVVWLLRELVDFCCDALDFGVRPIMYRN